MNKEDLLDILDDLKRDEFERFQFHLLEVNKSEKTTYVVQQLPASSVTTNKQTNKPQIKESELENKSRLETVDLMVRTFTPHGALEVTKIILGKIPRNDLLQRLLAISPGPEGNQPSADPSGSDPDETKRKKMNGINPQVKLSESESVLMAAEASNTLKSSTRSSALVPEEKENNEDPQVLDEIRQRLIRLASSTYRVNDEDLRKLIKTQPINKVELLQFLCTLDHVLRVSTQDTYRSVTPQASSQKSVLIRLMVALAAPEFSTTMLKQPPVKVHPFVTGRTFGADDVILQRVSQSINVEKTNDQDCDFIIVFCPIKSRVGSDVEAAMRKTPGGKPVILVLMHYTKDVNFSVDIKRWSDTYDNIKLDVHVLYHETQSGLLTCLRNDGAIQQIQKLLGKHKK